MRAPLSLIASVILPAALALAGCAASGASVQPVPANAPSPANTPAVSAAPSPALPAATAQAQPSPTAKADLDAPSTAGALHVEGVDLVGEDGSPVQLRGVSTHGLAWYPQYVNEECFALLRRQWQVNTVRLAMYTAESGGYCTDGDREKLLALVLEGVRCAAAQDLYAIVDWHVLSEGDPRLYADEALDFFDRVSAACAEQTHVLYEICNEPNGPVTWPQVKEYALPVIQAIRANDPDAVILVGTPTWSQDIDAAAADPIDGYGNILYTLHFYAATHGEELRERLLAARQAGLPVFVSEFGPCAADGNGALDEAQATRWIQALEENGIGYVAWNLSNKAESAALLLPSCEKTSGFTVQDLSPAGQWLYRTLTGDADDTQPPQTGMGAPQDGQTGMRVSATLRDSWESDGETAYLYDVVLENPSAQACDGWQAVLDFAGDIVFQEGWNARFTVQGSTLLLEPENYNRQVAAGDAVRDIGFIVRGAPLLPTG